MNNSSSVQFQELAFYTLAHPDMEYFIHQHIVDAYQAQTADESTKPIAIIFSLAGLYLFAEKGYTGRMVQLAHMKMARNKVEWPGIDLPAHRGNITISEVLDATPGILRDEMIKNWAISVWTSYGNSHDIIKSLVTTMHVEI